MRAEEKVLDEILQFAGEDSNIEIAVLNGSRVNPNAPEDFMQDYDVRLYVSDLTASYRYKADRSWIGRFGDLVMLQQNNSRDGSFIFLLQYKDSLRIDLSFQDKKETEKELSGDSLSKILLDKHDYVRDLPLPDESSYHTQCPSVTEWNETLNELWWLQCYIAKELWRKEMPLVKYLYDVHFMDCLRQLVIWHISAENDWKLNVGKAGKWLGRFLPAKLYEEYISFYCGADYNEQWDKLLRTGSFIRRLGVKLSEKLGYEYPMQDDVNVSEYIRQIHSLKENDRSLEG